jgi:dTDP-L-rhamnose 4-epimerase
MTGSKGRALKVLITGGAGFIGIHLARRLLKEGCKVTILDNFNPQVHRDQHELPADLQGKTELIVGDVRHKHSMRQALEDQDVVVHLAAETGTGQSMYAVKHYVDVNAGGIALLMDYCANHETHTIKKIVVASSRAIYGEGKYQCLNHRVVYPDMRNERDMMKGKFEPVCPICGGVCSPLATDELSETKPASVYGLTKLFQEQLALLIGKTTGASVFALRFQNVYGPGQSLDNPYTGILAIFSNLARLDKTIHIFEDGLESRDFIYIEDAVEVLWRCIHPDVTGVEVFNAGSGKRTSVLQVAREIVEGVQSESQILITGEFRLGDIRHNFADLTKARQKLGFEPAWEFKEGIREFLTWTQKRSKIIDRYKKSLAEVRVRDY